MDVKEFAENMDMLYTKIVVDPYTQGIYWEDFEELTELTKYIDYGCNFKNGACKIYYRPGYQPECCCKFCFRNVGYLRIIPNYCRLTELAPYFYKDVGFWKVGMGCQLPRKWRSSICLSHNCKSIDYSPISSIPKSKETMDALLIYLIRFGIDKQKGNLTSLFNVNHIKWECGRIVKDFIREYKLMVLEGGINATAICKPKQETSRLQKNRT